LLRQSRAAAARACWPGWRKRVFHSRRVKRAFRRDWTGPRMRRWRQQARWYLASDLCRASGVPVGRRRAFL